MKKILCVVCTFLVSLAMLVGCSSSNETTTQKTEEELRAEIKAEMEEEAKNEKDLEEKNNAEQKQTDQTVEKAEEQDLDIYDDIYTLEGFENETVYGEIINYDEYIAVIIPLYDGINKDKLDYNEFEIGSDTNAKLTFAVFGMLEEVVISHVENGMVDPEPTIKKVGNIENAIVTIKTTLPTDFSSVGVTGIVSSIAGQNTVEFGLDDMRDSSEYEAIVIK